jgi:MFS family permease
MSIENSSANKSFRNRLILPALLFGMFLVWTVTYFVSTDLVDIAKTFKVTIGTFSQFGLVSHFLGLFLGLVMGAISLRFKHKSLYLLGVALYCTGALLFFFAPNIQTVFLAYFFTGTGAGTIGIMIFSLIGGLFPLEKRAWAVGLVVSAVMFAGFFVGLVTGAITQVAGWHSVLLWFIIPSSVACFVLGMLAIPSMPNAGQPPAKSTYSTAFKQILFNKSAMACVSSNALRVFIAVVPIYAVSFYRLDFHVTVATGGRLSNRFGRKPIAVIAVIVSGISCILFTFVTNIAISVAIWGLAAFTIAMMASGLQSLVLEQVPGFRSTMMSVSSTFEHIGAIAGILIAGFVLNIYANNFQLLMTILGAVGAASGLVLLMAKDPCRISPST